MSNGGNESWNVVKDLISGTAGGLAGISIGQPLDTVKVRLQAMTSAHYRGAIDCLVSTVRTEGVGALFKGTAARAVSITPLNAIVFATFAKSMRVMNDNNLLPPSPAAITVSNGVYERETPNYARLTVAGTAAGFVQSFISSPAELVKCRMQVQNTTAGGHPMYRNSMHCIRSTITTGGVPALFRGLTSTMARDTPAYALYWVANEWAKYHLMRVPGMEPTKVHMNKDGTPTTKPVVPVSVSLTAGGFSGVVTWLIAYPFDPVKSVIQTAPLTTPRAELTMWHVARTMYREHGTQFFFRGLGTTLVRAVPVNALVFYGYEYTHQLLSRLD